MATLRYTAIINIQTFEGEKDRNRTWRHSGGWITISVELAKRIKPNLSTKLCVCINSFY